MLAKMPRNIIMQLLVTCGKVIRLCMTAAKKKKKKKKKQERTDLSS